MAWAYCDTCHDPLDFPSIEDGFAGYRNCPGCGATISLSETERRAVGECVREKLERADAFHTRVARLEETIVYLTKEKTRRQ